MSRARPLVDEVANELDTWPGVRIGRRADGAAVVLYEELELGVLYPERGVAELSFWHPEHDALVDHGDAEAASPAPESELVTHEIHGPIGRDRRAGALRSPLPRPARRRRALQLPGPRLTTAEGGFALPVTWR